MKKAGNWGRDQTKTQTSERPDITVDYQLGPTSISNETMEGGTHSRSLDPILNLPVKSQATSVCFVSRKNSSNYSSGHRLTELNSNELGQNNDDSYGCRSGREAFYSDYDVNDDDDDDDELEFRSSGIRRPAFASIRSQPHGLLSDRFLASCHSDGEALIWDLKNQKQVATVSPTRGGSGICIRRTEDPSQIMYQSQDPKGTVSLHSIERCNVGGPHKNTGSFSVPTNSTATRQYETYSQTFCRAAPCHGNNHLFALPNIDHSTVTVVDDRTNADVAKYSIDNHGMLTSLALSATDNNAEHGSGRPFLACGMESGTILFYDITSNSKKSFFESSFSIGKDPVLTLDTTPSRVATSAHSSEPFKEGSDTLLVAAGMAGDAQDISELSEGEAGRAVIFKATCNRDDQNMNSWNFHQRARLSTCRVDRDGYNGKPGISVCRFRPEDGRLLAIGGWDRRIRLFERSKGTMVALLKGGTGSVADIDWAPDSTKSGLLAIANRDDKLITLWQCFQGR